MSKRLSANADVHEHRICIYLLGLYLNVRQGIVEHFSFSRAWLLSCSTRNYSDHDTSTI